MSDLIINWRFGIRHFQVHKNRPYITFKVNPYWIGRTPTKWFEIY